MFYVILHIWTGLKPTTTLGWIYCEEGIDRLKNFKNHPLRMARNENNEDIVIIHYTKDVPLILYKCCINFNNFLSVFHQSQPCDIIKS